MSQKTALIIGAGPAGLTASFEFLKRTGIKPIVLEKSDSMGGISRTVRYKGNRMDIGGHRFFSKSDRVMDWWINVMPVQGLENGAATISYQNQSRDIATAAPGPDPSQVDRVMLVRTRKSRIYFLRKFFEYPVKFNTRTIRNLGIPLTFLAGLSYMKSMALPIKPEENLEQFLINRFGRRLYLLFFKSYTEKVWGVPCDQISAEWGAQRIKGLSISKALGHFVKSQSTRPDDIAQKDIETSLIERFLYPKLGPGQLWEFVAASIVEQGGEIHCGWSAEKFHREGNCIVAVEAVHLPTGERQTFTADYYFSTMPIKDLIHGMNGVPPEIREISDGLQYRDFITVGVLLSKLKIGEETPRGRQLLTDNWIYVQEPDVLVGRIQIFNNWSPYMVKDPGNVWLGLEYFCYESDPLWNLTDEKMIALAKEELERMGMADGADVLDATVIRMPKTYPAYFGAYQHFDRIRDYVDQIENLFLIGRNGMHRYNNQDHSMLTAMMAVDNIAAGIKDKSNLWEVNTEMEYHEAKKVQ
jgi:protoporphyrinogen oxidase